MLRAVALIIGLSAVLPVAAAAGTIIPVAFRGNWAPTLADCGDRDRVNVMHIASRRIGFYEARSDPDDFRVETVSPRRVRIRTIFDSEGKRLAAVMDFELSPDRQALAWSGFGRDPQAKERSVRCPS